MCWIMSPAPQGTLARNILALHSILLIFLKFQSEGRFYLRGAGGEDSTEDRSVAAFPEGLRLVPSIFLQRLTSASNPSSREFNTVSGLQGHLCVCVHARAHTHTHQYKYIFIKGGGANSSKFYQTVARTLIL